MNDFETSEEIFKASEIKSENDFSFKDEPLESFDEYLSYEKVFDNVLKQQDQSFIMKIKIKDEDANPANMDYIHDIVTHPDKEFNHRNQNSKNLKMADKRFLDSCKLFNVSNDEVEFHQNENLEKIQFQKLRDSNFPIVLVKKLSSITEEDFENFVPDLEGFQNIDADFEEFENLEIDFEGFENAKLIDEIEEDENQEISQFISSRSVSAKSSKDCFGKKKNNIRNTINSSSTKINVGKLFKCFVCNYETRYKSCLKKHLLFHSNRNCFKCFDCDYATYNKKNLQSHLFKHFDQTLFKCFTCKYMTNDQRNYRRHLLNHKSKKKYNCSICEFNTNYRSNFFTHLIRHKIPRLLIECAVRDGKYLKCFLCGFVTTNEDFLGAHLVQHSESKWLRCSECEYKTIEKNNLKRHVLNHSGSKFLKCSECSYATNDYGHLKRHKLTCKSVSKSASKT